MSDSVCLRCDWLGTAAGTVCPRCGAPLYGSQPVPANVQGSPGRGRGEAAEQRPIAAADRRPGSPPRSSEPAAPAPGVGAPRRRPWQLLTALAVVTGGLALAWAFLPSADTSARAPAGPSPVVTVSSEPPPNGFLLYAADPDGSGDEVLWTLDLASGEAIPGPRIPRITALSDASLAGRGWVGLTVDRPGRDVRTFVLHGTDLADHAIPVGDGDLAAWAPRGDVVALAHRGEPVGGCRRVRIDVFQVATGARERALRIPRLCGDIRALGRDINSTYFASRSGDTAGIYAVGIDVAHPVLRGFALQGVSPTADFLVTPVGGTGRPAPGAGTWLFWPGTGGPIPYGHVDQPLVVRRVLAWSQDGSQAAVIGNGGTQRGIFLLDTSAGADPRRLGRFIGASGRSTFGSFARDGSLYLAIDGVLVRYAAGSAEEVGVPPSAAPPAGPILWIP